MNYLPLFTKAFNDNGFEVWLNPKREREGFSYKGSVFTTRWGNIEIEFYFSNKTLTSFPKAYISSQSHSELQPYYFPHLDDEWKLCFDDGLKIFNIKPAIKNLNYWQGSGLGV